MKLPNVCWTFKLHKNSTKARFLIVAPKCSVKQLLKAVTATVKIPCNQVEHYFKTQYNFLSIHQAVIDAINKINSRNQAISISTFNFSALYTKEFIGITKYGVISTSDRPKYNLSFK